MLTKLYCTLFLPRRCSGLRRRTHGAPASGWPFAGHCGFPASLLTTNCLPDSYPTATWATYLATYSVGTHQPPEPCSDDRCPFAISLCTSIATMTVRYKVYGRIRGFLQLSSACLASLQRRRSWCPMQEWAAVCLVNLSLAPSSDLSSMYCAPRYLDDPR